jgi:putative iron-regulated protein
VVKIPPPQNLVCLFLALAVAAGTGCERKTPAPDPADIPSLEPVEPLTAIDPAQAAATVNIWARGGTLLEQVLTSWEGLHQALEALLADPTPQTLTEARDAWRRCHENWHRLDPIVGLGDSSPGLFARLQQKIFTIDAHPLLPGYIDYVEAYPYSGIVNDISLAINASNLRAQHGLTDEGDVALGFHALEFLLWGEHGQRPVEDFTVTRETTAEQRAAGLNIADLPNNRRRDMLLLLSHLLRDDVRSLYSRWQDRDSWLYATYHQLHPAVRAQLWKNSARHYMEQALQQVEDINRDYAHSAFATHNLAPIAAGLKELETLVSEEETSLPWFSDQEFEQQWLAALAATISLVDTHLTAEQELSEEEHGHLVAALGELLQQLTTEHERHL